jgi:hypothetical protein
MSDEKNRMLPSATFEPIDNGYLITFINTPTGQVIERKVLSNLLDALRDFKDVSNKVGKELDKLGKKEDPKETEEEI